MYARKNEKKRGRSASALAAKSVSTHADETSFDELLADALAQTGGPPTRSELALARRLLRGSA